MADRLTRIAQDAAAAREQLLTSPGAPAATVGKAPLRVVRLELDEEAVCFQVGGIPGEFTAFLADPYPGGETAVYGPDDLEFQHSGTVAMVITGVLEDLWQRRASGLCGGAASSQAPAPIALERPTSAASMMSTMGDGSWSPIKSHPPEQLLLSDLQGVRNLLGADAVQVAEQADGWRVRIAIGLRAICGSDMAAVGEPLISRTTAEAWGLNPELPIIVELHLPKVGYLSDSMPINVVKRVWQEGYPKFLLEKQLLQILTDFCAVRSGRPLTPVCGFSGDVFISPEELLVMQEFEQNKTDLMNKVLADRGLGLMGHLVLYTQLRITTLHKYCALCDQSFAVSPMLLRTVCTRELCLHQLASFGDKLTTAEGINTQAEIVDLLVCMFARAVQSDRRDLVVDPYPCVYSEEDARNAVLHPRKKDFNKLQDCMMEIMNVRKREMGRVGAAWTALAKQMSPAGAGLVQWIMASNRTFLAPLREPQRITAFKTPFQYLSISAPPETEATFQKLKEQHGSIFAYHGSPVGNWHSILRNGLKNATHSRLQAHGANYGPGIYLSASSKLSLRYCAAAGMLWSDPPKLQRQTTGNRVTEHLDSLAMLAVCEVIDHPSLSKFQWGYVAKQEEIVCTRFFLVMNHGRAQDDIKMTDSLTSEIRRCMRDLHVGLSSAC